MKSSILTFSLSLLLGTTLAHGATHNVGAGESIQTAVDTASSGDTIVLTAPADYDGNVTIAGKALRIVSLHRNNHDIMGSITISAVPAGQSVTFKNLSISGPVSATDSSLNLLRCTMGEEVNATNLGNANTQLAVVQSNLSGKLSSTLTRTWIGYSDLRQSYFEGQVEIVGNNFNGAGLGGIGIDIYGNSTQASIHNNNILGFFLGADHSISNSCIGIRIDGGAEAIIKNNNISGNYDSQDVGSEVYVGIGILVNSSGKTDIISNYLHNNYVKNGYKYHNAISGGPVNNGNCNIQSNSTNVLVRYNKILAHAHNGSSTLKGTMNQSSNIANSTLQNNGSPKEIDSDHDGTRNDIGANGGRNYIPNGRTTDKPIPISFTVAPQIVPIGGTVTIESTGATVK